MKALSKPLSSPGRAEKFPPPLMRFLRSNVGSRSRGRSRSSPIFYLRTKKTTVPAGVIQEPSSPKVTCIGQVRVRRSAKTKPRKTGGAPVKPRRRRRRCWWLKKTMFCGKIPWRLRWRKRPFTGVFCRWGLCLRWWWCCKKVDGTEDSFRGYCNEKSEKSGGGNDSESGCSNNKYENVGVGAAQESKRDCVEMESSSSPPKNALLLTRCRSAPYRSSSLGGRFWGSPLSQKDEPQNESEEVVQDNPSPIPNPSCCQNVVDEEARTISLQENSQELEMMKKKKKKNNNSGEEDLKGVNVAGGLTAVHPLLLTRCKSEPARTGERLIINPQPPNQTRFDNSSLHNS